MSGDQPSGGGGSSKGTPPLMLVSQAGIASKYSEAEFLVGGNRGKQGQEHGELKRCWFKIHEGYEAEAQQVISAKRFPYNYLSNLWAHGAVRHLKWLAGLEDWEHTVFYNLQMIDEITADAEMRVRIAKSLDGIGTMIADLLEMPGGLAEAGRRLRRIKAGVEAMRDRFWRDHMMKLFLQRWSPYMHGGIVMLERSNVEPDDE